MTEQNRPKELKSQKECVITRHEVLAIKKSVHHSADQTVEYRLGEVNLVNVRLWDRLFRRFTPRNDARAFTLAEILITLGIIGIVATITIPALVSNIQDRQFKTQLLKEYSVLQQAYKQIENEYGQISYALGGISGSGTNGLKNILKSELSYIKECDVGSKAGICFPSSANIKYLNGLNTVDSYIADTYASGLVLQDGAAYTMYLDSKQCTSTLSPSYNDRCGWLTIDVNGLQGPNTWGKDIYLFFIFSNAVRPSSANSTLETSIETADDCGVGTKHGYSCSSKYLMGG